MKLAIACALLLDCLMLSGQALRRAGEPAAPAKPVWRIKGRLSEACTCSVPCTCNFGEAPSPYEYCYTMWSYWVQEGNWEQVVLKDVRIGGVQGPRGVMALLDARAAAPQRPAMENLWQAVSGRLLCMLRLWPLKAGQGSLIRVRFPDRQFLGYEYLPIEQAITARAATLRFGDRGGFEANYIFGRDPEKPITVSNIVSWPVPVSIKGKTVFFRYKDKFHKLDYQGTNANQGDFDLSWSQPGGLPMMVPK